MQSHALRERVNAVEWAGFGGCAGGCASLTRPTVKSAVLQRRVRFAYPLYGETGALFGFCRL